MQGSQLVAWTSFPHQLLQKGLLGLPKMPSAALCYAGVTQAFRNCCSSVHTGACCLDPGDAHPTNAMCISEPCFCMWSMPGIWLQIPSDSQDLQPAPGAASTSSDVAVHVSAPPIWHLQNGKTNAEPPPGSPGGLLHFLCNLLWEPWIKGTIKISFYFFSISGSKQTLLEQSK